LQAHRIGLLIVATGKYIDFVPALINSARTNFCKNHHVIYFVFTDGQLPAADDVVVLPHQKLGWPYDTLCRNFAYCAHSELLGCMDYLFALDADMLFVAPVGDEILSERVGVIHPGFSNDPNMGTPEERIESTAYLNKENMMHYYAGGFFGGIAAYFLSMVATIRENIMHDAKKDIIAIWHDESHLNRYFVDNPPTLVLSPSYCYPGSFCLASAWGLFHLPPKLVALDKDHAAVRA